MSLLVAVVALLFAVAAFCLALANRSDLHGHDSRLTRHLHAHSPLGAAGRAPVTPARRHGPAPEREPGTRVTLLPPGSRPTPRPRDSR